MKSPGWKRTLALTLVLGALPLPFLLPGATRLLGGPDGYRRLALWGIPIAAFLVATFFSLGGRRGYLFGGSRASTLRIAPWCFLALIVDYSCLGIGQLLGWITFTFGDQTIAGHPFRALTWGLPLSLVLGIFGWEWALRRTVFLSWLAHLSRPAAMAVSCILGVALTAPSILPGLEIPDASYASAAFLVAACREISFTLIFASGAGLPAAGIYRGLLTTMDAFLIADWYSVPFPMANFTTSEPAFYLVRGATALLAAGLIAFGTRWAAPPRTASSA